jgi:hypothetical protein
MSVHSVFTSTQVCSTNAALISFDVGLDKQVLPHGQILTGY